MFKYMNKDKINEQSNSSCFKMIPNMEIAFFTATACWISAFIELLPLTSRLQSDRDQINSTKFPLNTTNSLSVL